jgi:hypothetical protein
LRALRRPRVSDAEVNALVEAARADVLRVFDLALDDEADLARIYERCQAGGAGRSLAWRASSGLIWVRPEYGRSGPSDDRNGA